MSPPFCFFCISQMQLWNSPYPHQSSNFQMKTDFLLNRHFDTLIYGNLGFIIEYSTGIIKPKTISIFSVYCSTHHYSARCFWHEYDQNPETYKPKFHCRRQSGMNFGYVTENGVNSNILVTTSSSYFFTFFTFLPKSAILGIT